MRGKKKTSLIFSLDRALCENVTEQAVIMKGWDIKVALQGESGPCTWFYCPEPDCLQSGPDKAISDTEMVRDKKRAFPSFCRTE
jgi:hypothetical protein